MIEAEKRLGASRKFDDYLTVGVLDLRKAVDTLVEEEWAGVWRPISERLFSVKGRPSDILLPVMDNLFAISHFLPNMAPYTVFPISPRFRLALMLGDLLVMSLLNVSGLARWLAKRGWRLKF